MSQTKAIRIMFVIAGSVAGWLVSFRFLSDFRFRFHETVFGSALSDAWRRRKERRMIDEFEHSTVRRTQCGRTAPTSASQLRHLAVARLFCDTIGLF